MHVTEPYTRFYRRLQSSVNPLEVTNSGRIRIALFCCWMAHGRNYRQRTIGRAVQVVTESEDSQRT